MNTLCKRHPSFRAANIGKENIAAQENLIFIARTYITANIYFRAHMGNYRFKSGVALITIVVMLLIQRPSAFGWTAAYLLTAGLILSSREVFLVISLRKTRRSHPKFVKLGSALSVHVIWSILLDGLFTAFGAMAVIRLFTEKKQFVWMIILSAVLVPVNRFLLANNTLRLLKQIAGYKFNIIVFRRFSAENSFVVKQIIAPELGAYGNIISIWDKNLAAAKAGANADSEDVMGESSASIRADDSNWQKIVTEYLERSDCFVFYWPDMPTANMLWEYQICLKFKIDDERFLFILHKNTASKIKENLERAKPGNKYTILEIGDVKVDDKKNNADDHFQFHIKTRDYMKGLAVTYGKT